MRLVFSMYTYCNLVLMNISKLARVLCNLYLLSTTLHIIPILYTIYQSVVTKNLPVPCVCLSICIISVYQQKKTLFYVQVNHFVSKHSRSSSEEYVYKLLNSFVFG